MSAVISADREAELDAEERLVVWLAYVGERLVRRLGPGLTQQEADIEVDAYLRSGWYRGGSDDYHRYTLEREVAR